MKLFRLILIIMILFFFKDTVLSSHIIGGEMTYECIASTHFNIKMMIYRDCEGDLGAVTPFDTPAFFTILKGDGSIFMQNGQSFFTESYDTIETIPYPEIDSCIQTINAGCIDRAIYEFNLNLPFDSLGYYIVYERCCRANLSSLTNLTNINGITISTFISKEAQLWCNSSPTFNEMPPLFLFNNELRADFSATDIDGDSLVYVLCTPHNGASPTHPQPQITSGLPFSAVQYKAGFMALQPVNGTFYLNNQNGFTSGYSNILGSYSVAVCVEEYRNETLLSNIKRDFPINIAPFGYDVNAQVQADSIDNTTYFIHTCDTSLRFINQSSHSFYINDYLWEFDIDGQTISSTLTHPVIDFPNDGMYQGKLIVNPTLGCQDSISIVVNVGGNTLPVDFSFQYDSSKIDSVYFQATSSNNINEWRWNFGDEHYSFASQPSHLYSDSGSYQVSLVINDGFSCGRISKIIDYFPIPILLSTQDFTLFENVQLQPNPASEYTYMIFDNENNWKDIELFLYHTTGQLIFHKKEILNRKENRLTIDTTTLDQGIYWILLKKGDQVQPLKLVKSSNE